MSAHLRFVAILVSVAFLIGGARSPVQAQFLGLTQWNSGPGANHHWYAMTEYAGDYHEVTSVAQNLGGTLVSITSSMENEFVYNSLIAYGSCTYSWCAPATYFIGLERESPGGTFAWQTGEDVSFTAWNVGEPNNDQTFGDEMVAHAFRNPSGDIVWNDIPYGYPNVMRGVIEWDYNPRVSVPEPSGLLLLGTGFLMLGVVGRRRIVAS